MTYTWRDRIADDGFADWLNIVDARIDYDVRRRHSLFMWRLAFDHGYSVNEAVAMSSSNFVELV